MMTMSRLAWHPLFSVAEVAAGVFRIEERFFESWNRANIFYVRGRGADLLIDTGTGIYDLGSFLDWSGLRGGDRGGGHLHVVLTHCHFDHAGGLHHFRPDAHTSLYAHRAEVTHALQGGKYMSAAWVTPSEVIPKPSSTWNARHYRVEAVSNVIAVQEGHVFDLGDRKFEVIELGGHTPGSLGLVDAANGVVASGDALYATDHELIDWYPASSVLDMARSVRRLADLAAAGHARVLLPGHNHVLHSPLDIARAANTHLNAMEKTRPLRKSLSRLRARVVLGLNAVLPVPLPDNIREAIKN